MLEEKPLDILKNDIKNYWIGILLAIIYLIIASLLFHNVCPSKLILGLPCPGCGLTRACLHIITLDIKEAIRINASSFLWFLLILEAIIQRYLFRRRFNKINLTALFFVAFITIIYFLYRVFGGILPLDI